MLLRYAHLCTQSLAQRLDEAFSSKKTSVTHHGRKRLTREAKLPLKSIIDSTFPEQQDAPSEDSQEEQTGLEKNVTTPAESVSVTPKTPELPAPLPENVITVDFKRRAA